jgi:hypothetical protein
MILKINTPHVVHETIEGETVLLNLQNGYYYSFDGAGALVWEGLVYSGSTEAVYEKVPALQDHQSDITSFIDQLLEEELLVKTEAFERAPEAESPYENEKLVKEAVENYQAPSLNKYTDLEELLLLDPIHDVDEEKGWPEAN